MDQYKNENSPSQKISNSDKLEEVYASGHNLYEETTGENLLNALMEIIIYIVVILVLVVTIRYFLIAPFSVDGSSMVPNLEHNELIIVNKIGYSNFFGFQIGKPERGDIVVLIPPNDTNKFYVKRVIGLPEEKVEFNSGEIVIHNSNYPEGVRIEEPYLSEENRTTTPPGGYRNKIIALGDREYYVLGDNRSHSSDSRSFGPINQANIVGRVWFVVWPIEKIRLISHYLYSIFELPLIKFYS